MDDIQLATIYQAPTIRPRAQFNSAVMILAQAGNSPMIDEVQRHLVHWG